MIPSTAIGVCVGMFVCEIDRKHSMNMCVCDWVTS